MTRYRALALYTVLLLLGLWGLPARATTLDAAARALDRNRRVYDFAGVLSREDQRRLHDRLARMEQSGLAEGAVVLLDRLEGGTVEDYGRELGRRWRIGREGVDNGFVLLVSTQDRKWRLEVGRNLGVLLPDAAAGRLMREHLAPAFREGRYADGLEAGLTAVEARLQRAGGTEALPARRADPGPPAGIVWLTLLFGAAAAALAFRAWPRGSVPGADPWRLPQMLLGFGSLGCAALGASQAPGSGTGLLFLGLPPGAWALFRSLEGAWVPLPLETASRLGSRAAGLCAAALGLVLLAWLFTAPSGFMVPFVLLAVPLTLAVRGYFQRVPRRCPECGGALRWLPENEEAQFLRDEENAEQRLGSVDYDVWRCAKCSRSAVFSHLRPLAPFATCPRCQRRTLARRTLMEPAAGIWGSGWAREIDDCQNPRCGYRDERRREVESGGLLGGGGGGLVIIPPVWGGGWGGSGGGWGGQGGDAGGDAGGIDVGDFGGGGGFDGGGASGDW